MIISGFSELLTISALLPFLSVITNPDNILNYKITTLLAKFLDIRQSEDLIVPIIFFFIFCIVLSTSIRLINIWITYQYSALIGSDLSEQIYSNNIYQKYEYHINNNSSKFLTVATKSISATTTAVGNILNVVSHLILSVFLLCAIISINGKLAIYSLFTFIVIYLIIGKTLNKRIGVNSKIIYASNQSIIKSIQEGLGTIRNIFLECNQAFFIKRYRNLYFKLSSTAAKNLFFGEFPRYAIEGLALLLVAIVSFFIITKNSSNSIIVILGGFVLGVQRLLPSIQRIYVSWSNIRGNSEDIINTIKILELRKSNFSNKGIKPLDFKKSIKLVSLNFSYLNSNQPVVSNLSLEIFKGEKIGFIGKTGSGKSTTIDLLMGLLKPTMGKIYVDNIDIYDKRFPGMINKWRFSISHVPQSIFLTDNTIAENIAFGIDKNDISIKAVKEAAKKAQIHEFIESKPDGYNTIIGEGGIKLSGGQRQRIGIARALFKKKAILVLDEATSALDNKTEKDLINSISSLNPDLTIISIAHRYSSLKNCDRIIELSNGKIKNIMQPKDL